MHSPEEVHTSLKVHALPSVQITPELAAHALVLVPGWQIWQGLFEFTPPPETHWPSITHQFCIKVRVQPPVLVSQAAPAEIRGSVIGFYGLCGAAAQILISQIGGRLFSGWRECGPFVLVGVLNLVLMVIALLMRKRIQATA